MRPDLSRKELRKLKSNAEKKRGATAWAGVAFIAAVLLVSKIVVANDPPTVNGQALVQTVHGLPQTAMDYAKLVEPELGIPPRIVLDECVEIPLYVDGEQRYGNLGRALDNPSFLGKGTVSGSVLQRYEGRTADGEPLPDVVWVAFGRNTSQSHRHFVGSVQMIGYHRKTGATAFFESGDDKVAPWVQQDEETLRMRGKLPWIDEPENFNTAFRTFGATQCVQCHQNDPFITNDFITAAKIPGTNEPVIPILDADSPYYVIGGEKWDMRTIHIEGNRCFDCHRVGMSTMTMFMENGWKPDAHMPPHDPGSLNEDLMELLEAWRKGPENVPGAEWVVPPARGQPARVVGEDYPNQAFFNRSDYSFYGSLGWEKGRQKFDDKTVGPQDKQLAEKELREVKQLLKKLPDADTRTVFEDWIEKNGVNRTILEKLRELSKDRPETGKPDMDSDAKSAEQEKSRTATLADLKVKLTQAVESGKLTKQQAIEEYEKATGKLADGDKPEDVRAKIDLSDFTAKLKQLVAGGKLTEADAKDLYESVFSGDSSKTQRPKAPGVKKSDYKKPGLSLGEQQKLSASLPTTSTAGDQEGPVATGFFGWAAEATHRFLDNSHRGEPRLIEGLSFRLDHRDHDSIGRSWENVTIRMAHGDWSSIKYNASEEFDLVDESVVAFSKPWSFPTLKGFPVTEPAEWGGPQNALNFRFDKPFEYNGKDAIYVEFVFSGGKAEDGRPWEGDLPFGFEYYLDSMPEAGGWRVAERPVGLYRAPRVEAVVSYTAGGQSVWTSSPKGMPYLKWDFRTADE